MREPLQSYANSRPLPRRVPPGKNQSYQRYQRQRRQQFRLLALGVGAALTVGLAALATWGVVKAQPLLFHPANPDTSQFEALLKRDFGYRSAPSLLYADNTDRTMLGLQPPSSFQNKLLPILPAKEDNELKNQLEGLFAEYPAGRFTPHLYFFNPQDNSYVELNGYSPVPAASVIKLPILLDYLLSLDENTLKMETPLLYAEFHRAGGAGELQYQPTGQDFPANTVASQMIRISDNTCTNMMISSMGGTQRVNERLAELGLTQTRIRNWLPDLEGTNTISPYEMATILYNIDHGPLLSRLARTNGISILESTHNRRLLVTPLPPEAVVAHKTGDIGTALGDSGLVYMPDGRKYIISVQVERPYNDYTARDMIQRASRMIYDHVAAQKTNDTTSLVQAPATASTGI
jgi:beta-lactamase class A